MAKKSKRTWFKNSLESIAGSVTTIVFNNNSYQVSCKDDFKNLWRDMKDDDELVDEIGNLILKIGASSNKNNVIFKQRRTSIKKNKMNTKRSSEYKRFLLEE